MIKNDNQGDIIFAMSDETIGRQDPGTKVHIIDTDEDLIVAEDGISTYHITLGGGGSSSEGEFVGTVTNDGSFPTTRRSGSPLEEGDYVKPLATSNFPFTIGACTFNSIRDTAIYSVNSGDWQVDPGALQDTSETPVKNKTTESISGTKTTQAGINAENKTEIEKKVEQSTIDNQQLLYARENGTEKTVKYGAGADLGSGTIPTRVTGGNLQVGTPTADNHAASKQYVDEHSSSDLFKITATFNSGSTTEGVFDKTTEEIRTAYNAGKKLYVVLKTADDDRLYELVAIVCNASVVKMILSHSLYANTDPCLEVMEWNSGSSAFTISAMTEATKFQYNTLPTASAELFGKIYQYTGTTGTYTQGHFYVCTDDGAGGYEWSEISGGSGGGYEPDGITTKLNSDNQIATVVGGGETSEMTLLTWDSSNPATFFPKENTGMPTDCFAWESEFENVSEGDKITGKLSVDGTQSTFTDVEVEEIPMTRNGRNENVFGIKIPNIFGGTEDTIIYIFEDTIAVACTGTYSSSTVLLGEMKAVYQEPVILQIDGKYIMIDSTLLEVYNSGKLAVRISNESGNTIEGKDDGLYCAGGGGSVSIDNITIRENEDEEIGAVYGGGKYSTGWDVEQLVTTDITGSYDEGYGIPLIFFDYLSSENWKVGNTVEVKFSYNGTVKYFTDCQIIKKDFGEEYGEFKVIEVADIIEEGVPSYLGFVGSSFCFVSNSTFTSADSFVLSYVGIDYETFNKEPIEPEYVPYCDKFFTVNLDNEIQPKVEFGPWDEQREALHHTGSVTSEWSGNEVVVDSAVDVVQNGSTLDVSYSITLSTLGRLRPACVGTLEKISDTEYSCDLTEAESSTPDENILERVAFTTDTTPYKIHIYLNTEKASVSDIESFDELTIRQTVDEQVDHELPVKWVQVSEYSNNAITKRDDGLYVPTNGITPKSLTPEPATSYIEDINWNLSMCYQFGNIVIANLFIDVATGADVPKNTSIVQGLPDPAKIFCFTMAEYASDGASPEQIICQMFTDGHFHNCSTTLGAGKMYVANIVYFTNET